MNNTFRFSTLTRNAAIVFAIPRITTMGLVLLTLAPVVAAPLLIRWSAASGLRKFGMPGLGRLWYVPGFPLLAGPGLLAGCVRRLSGRTS